MLTQGVTLTEAESASSRVIALIRWNRYNGSKMEISSTKIVYRGTRKSDVHIQPCTNKEADDVFMQHYWMKRVRRSHRLSYEVFYYTEKVAWIQVADPFGTKLTKSLQVFDVQETVELCRGFFIDDAPTNIESCAIGKILRRLPNDWYSSFGIAKKLAIVYQDIDANQRGVVYRALGFKPYGYCVRARHHTAPTRGNSSGNKILWARGLKPVSGRHYKVLIPEIDYETFPSVDVRTGELEKSYARS